MIAGDIRNMVLNLQGPILVLGASGFIGANLLRLLLQHRRDGYGTSSRSSSWRLEGVPTENVISGDLLIEQSLKTLLDTVCPRTVFNCLAYGAYSFQTEGDLIYRTNLNLTARLVDELQKWGVHRYVHAGTSSEYGDEASGPAENSPLHPNSHYSVSKGAAAALLNYMGKKQHFPGVNLRLYSVYGPYEDSSRLVPTTMLNGLKGQHSRFVNPEISRDFLYIDDACEAFITAALNMTEAHYGESFNIGSGVKTTIGAFAHLCKDMFNLPGEPEFTMPDRRWDVSHWYANPAKARAELGWTARTPLRQGLERMATWCRALDNPEGYVKSSKKFGRDETWSVSA
ncbi:MAG: NAD(P)-dependent oxidoreductase [Azospirillaceae bacterium]|nr:NAD(P)-dependent oxidoreductase [Azospirillaceae bacterium]